MQSNSEQTYHNNLQRLLFQIKDNVNQSLKKIEEINLQNPSTSSQIELQRKNDNRWAIDNRRDVISQKLFEFRQMHWKIYEESQTNTIARNLRTLVKSQNSFPQFQDIVVHEAKEEILYLRELTQKKRFLTEYKFEVHEMTSFSQSSKEQEVQIMIYRPTDVEDRFWYLATFITTQNNTQIQQTFDIQINPIDPKKETSTIQKIKVDSEYIIYKKLNAWFRYLYFARMNQKTFASEDIQSFNGVLNYIKETMNRLFGLQSFSESDNQCQKCGQVLKLSSIKSEGFLLPYIYFVDCRQNHDPCDSNLSIDHQMFHEQCFFNVQS